MKNLGKRFWINLIVIVVVGVFSGYFVGNFYVNKHMGGMKADLLPTEENLRDNITDTIRKTKNKQVSQIGGTDCMVIAEYKLSQKDYVKRNTNGSVKAAGVTQKLVSTKALVNGEYYSEELSDGVVKLATKYYYTKDAASVSVYKGKIGAGLKGDYTSAEHYDQNIDDFNAANGVKPTYFINYIISSNTVVEEKYNGINKETGHHSFTLILNPSYAAKNYMYKVKQTSGSSEYPEFTDITVTFEIDDDFTLYKMTCKETYRVAIAVLGKVVTTGDIVDEFSYDNTFVIPR